MDEEMDPDQKEFPEPDNPVDHGFAWIILAASMFCTFNVLGTEKTYGLLYAEFIREYETTALSASLLQLVQPIVCSISTIIILTCGNSQLSCRQIAVLGGVLLFLAFGLSSFATSIYVLNFTYSFLVGVGTGCAYTSSIVILTFYFDKKRGMANGFMTASGSLGGLIMVPLLRIFIDRYTLSGALLLYSAICANIIVAGAIFRPPSFYRRKMRASKCTYVYWKQKQHAGSESHTEVTEKMLSMCTEQNIRKMTELPNYLITSEPLLNETSFEASYKENMGVFRKRSNSESHTSSINTKKRLFNSDTGIIHSVNRDRGRAYDNTTNIENNVTDKVKVDSPKRNWLKYFNFAILRNWAFVRIMFAYAIGSIGTAMPIYYIQIYAQELEIDIKKCDTLVVIAGGVEVLGRAFSGFLSDRIPVKRQYIMAVGLIIASISHALIQFYTSYLSLVIFAVIYGFFGASLAGLYTSTILDILGLHDFNSGLCLLWLLYGITVGSSSPIIGLIRETTGSYSSCFFYFSAMLLVSSCFLLADMAPCLKTETDTRK